MVPVSFSSQPCWYSTSEHCMAGGTQVYVFVKVLEQLSAVNVMAPAYVLCENVQLAVAPLSKQKWD